MKAGRLFLSLCVGGSGFANSEDQPLENGLINILNYVLIKI